MALFQLSVLAVNKTGLTKSRNSETAGYYVRLMMGRPTIR